MKQCLKCQGVSADDVEICRECGSKKFFPLKHEKVPCPSCGAENNPEASECLVCREKLH
jgi:ribosomal protein L40E